MSKRNIELIDEEMLEGIKIIFNCITKQIDETLPNASPLVQSINFLSCAMHVTSEINRMAIKFNENSLDQMNERIAEYLESKKTTGVM